MLLDPRPQIAAPLLPQRPHYERERAVAGRLGDADVEVAVGRIALLERAAMRAHAFDGLAERPNLCLANAARGERRNLAFDQPARGEELERTRALVMTVGRAIESLRDAAPEPAGWRRTKMPVPTRTSTRPAISSEISASRTDVRDTPRSTASSLSGGSREPVANSPLSISVEIWPAICR